MIKNFQDFNTEQRENMRGGDGTVTKQPVKKVVTIGRNDPCPCGSGLKWKKCTCETYHKEQ